VVLLKTQRTAKNANGQGQAVSDRLAHAYRLGHLRRR
jgi:hypothetical protein